MVTLDYGLVTQDPGSANYRVNNQLVTYGPLNFSLDAELADVIRPTTKFEYDRFNPSCTEPAVLVRNNGSETINSLTFSYQYGSDTPLVYEWTGSLSPLTQREIDLPVIHNSFWNGNTEGTFHVSITAINGGPDGNSDNNTMTTQYKPVFEFERSFRIEFRPDNKPFNTSYTITNSDGEQVFQRNGFQSSQTYSDILNLPGGCYTFRINDSDDDGLEFWFFPNNGIGTLRFDELDDENEFDHIAYQIEPDFGGTFYFEFMVRGTTSTEDDIEEISVMSLGPNPACNELQVIWEHPLYNHAQYKVFNSIGQQVLPTGTLSQGKMETVSTSALTSDKYLLVIFYDGNVRSEWFEVVK